MAELDEVLADNSLEDVNWLCSLSESELDLLVSLKQMVLKRAKVIGHEELAKRFDLKILRALCLILMEYFKGKVEDLSAVPGLANCSFLDGCNLLKRNSAADLSIEQLKACIGIEERKRPAKRSREEASVSKEK
ncbi:hypothetical protein K2173_006809 [Erythroxylum novogranatense]|uniref:Uncharacterized protein n=1 Tax=Erythroxylum novogranatense TaxID=1862640 RepID=A0AAV8SYS9_9ROSI|nr:hypothetical protein K2173_006809 [Erythroxylum novogranatense]